MAIVNKSILTLGVIPFILDNSNGKGWLIEDVSNSFDNSFSYTPVRGTKEKTNPIGDFDASVNQSINMTLLVNDNIQKETLETLLESLTLIDTVGSVVSSWNDSIITTTAKKVKNFILIPSLVCSFYSNNPKFNSFFFKLLSGVSINKYSNDNDNMFIIELTFTSEFIEEQLAEELVPTGSITVNKV
jgi:hypothetical protein